MSALKVLKRAQALVDRHATLAKEIAGVEKELAGIGVSLASLLNPAKSTYRFISESNSGRPSASDRGKIYVRRRNRIPKESFEDLVKLYLKGTEIAKIASTFKVSKTTVYRMLRKMRISKKPFVNPDLQDKKPTEKILHVITSMAVNGAVSRLTVRREARNMFKMNSMQVAGSIRALEVRKAVRSDGDMVYVVS